MAFLDNSGDIILDAVLTDIGRKRMAEGNFRITQFALGDDEIDYGLFNRNHPSGSAYYDLEILQTPVLEAFSKTNANINYGLVSFNGNLNLLYLPTAKAINKKIPGGTTGMGMLLMTGSVYYVPVDSDTEAALNTAFSDSHYYQSPGGASGIHIETGITSITEVPPRTTTLANRNTYIVNNDLLDSNFEVSVDERFISMVITFDPPSSRWYRDEGGGSFAFAMNNKTPVTPAGNAIGLDNYKTAIVPAIGNYVHGNESTAPTYKSYSEINGPPGMITYVAFYRHADMLSPDVKYSLYGRVSQDLFGDGNTYDYVDTTVYVVGRTTGVTLQLPIRMIRKRS